jgi:X-Pro dipeptidyl-peptidase (S15 family)
LIGFAALLLVLPGRAAAGDFTRQDVTIPMDDGVQLAATLRLPVGVSAPAGWPAVVMFHGIGGKRADLDAIADHFAAAGYAVLSVDFRGHGQSGGLVSIDGPREIRDVRELFVWLAARPDIADARIGAWGISLGGGAVLRAVAEGVPFKAAEVVQTWTDLVSALAPQNLSKSGAIYGFLGSVPPERTAPEVLALRNRVIASINLPAIRSFGRVRSSRHLLSRVSTPIYFFQGRRDFAFDIDQAVAGHNLLKGPKRLYIGDFGHGPSTFPGPDLPYVLDQGTGWFNRFLNPSSGTQLPEPPIGVAPNPWNGKAIWSNRLPAVRALGLTLRGASTMAASSKVVRSIRLPRRKLETFGAGTVTLTARLRSWPRLVAVVAARTPAGQEIVVTEGGINTRGLKGRRRLSIRLISQATVIPKGSRLTLTLASSSLAQNPANLLYLDLPMPRGARLSVGAVRVNLPVLKTLVSR